MEGTRCCMGLDMDCGVVKQTFKSFNRTLEHLIFFDLDMGMYLRLLWKHPNVQQGSN